MANFELNNSQNMNLTNKIEREKKIGQVKELLKNHIDKYKEAGMSDDDIDDYLSLYI